MLIKLWTSLGFFAYNNVDKIETTTIVANRYLALKMNKSNVTFKSEDIKRLEINNVLTTI